MILNQYPCHPDLSRRLGHFKQGLSSWHHVRSGMNMEVIGEFQKSNEIEDGWNAIDPRGNCGIHLGDGVQAVPP